jgi:hypothetical protein
MLHDPKNDVKADLLEVSQLLNRGWCCGHYHQDNRSAHCLVGAVYSVGDGIVPYSVLFGEPGVSTPRTKAMIAALNKALPLPFFSMFDYSKLVLFNDDCETVDEVLKLIERAREEL